MEELYIENGKFLLQNRRKPYRRPKGSFRKIFTSAYQPKMPFFMGCCRKRDVNLCPSKNCFHTKPKKRDDRERNILLSAPRIFARTSHCNLLLTGVSPMFLPSNFRLPPSCSSACFQLRTKNGTVFFFFKNGTVKKPCEFSNSPNFLSYFGLCRFICPPGNRVSPIPPEVDFPAFCGCW